VAPQRQRPAARLLPRTPRRRTRSRLRPDAPFPPPPPGSARAGPAARRGASPSSRPHRSGHCKSKEKPRVPEHSPAAARTAGGRRRVRRRAARRPPRPPRAGARH
jgi:hypothetical protein